jgi:hypothetical protein
VMTPGSGRPLSDAGMRAQLEALPPGHPSSPWNEDGTRKPPPPRLRDMELPLPGAWRDYPEDDPPGPAEGSCPGGSGGPGGPGGPGNNS